MKSIAQTIIVLAVLLVAYLYITHDKTDGNALIVDLETRAGAIDVQERKIEELKASLLEEIKRYSSGNKAEIDSLSEKLKKLTSDLAYNQKVRRLDERKMTPAETLAFDSVSIIPFQRKIDRIEQRMEDLSPTGMEDLKAELKEELRKLLNQKEALNRLIVSYSSYFFDAPNTGGQVVVENGLDAYGRPAKNKDQFSELSDMLFGKYEPTKEQRETFRQFHQFWCDLPGEQSSNVCGFPWLEGTSR